MYFSRLRYPLNPRRVVNDRTTPGLVPDHFQAGPVWPYCFRVHRSHSTDQTRPYQRLHSDTSFLVRCQGIQSYVSSISRSNKTREHLHFQKVLAVLVFVDHLKLPNSSWGNRDTTSPALVFTS